MILLDTSVLVASLARPNPTRPNPTGPQKTLAALIELVKLGDQMLLPSMVLYEWRRGPRTAGEISDQERLFPSEFAIPFTAAEAVVAANLYRHLARPRGREIDIAIAACAIVHQASLWTLNRRDFADIPGVRFVDPIK